LFWLVDRAEAQKAGPLCGKAAGAPNDQNEGALPPGSNALACRSVVPLMEFLLKLESKSPVMSPTAEV